MGHIPEAKVSLRPASFVAGNVPEFDASGNPVDSGEVPGGGSSLLAISPPVAPAATYTLTATYDVYELQVPIEGTATATLPEITAGLAGKSFWVRQMGPGALTVAADAEDTPPGVDDGGSPPAGSVTLGAGEIVHLVCIGPAWVIMSRYTPPA
jgi:hypothetical protein